MTKPKSGDGVMSNSPRYDTQEGDRYIRRGDDRGTGPCEPTFFVSIEGGSRNCAGAACVKKQVTVRRACGFPAAGPVCDFATTREVSC